MAPVKLYSRQAHPRPKAPAHGGFSFCRCSRCAVGAASTRSHAADRATLCRKIGQRLRGWHPGCHFYGGGFSKWALDFSLIARIAEPVIGGVLVALILRSIERRSACSRGSHAPWRNALRTDAASAGDLALSHPITCIAVCCARATRGQPTAEPAIVLIKSRRRTQPSPKDAGKA